MSNKKIQVKTPNGTVVLMNKEEIKKNLSIYISGPMSGYKDYNYPKFQKISSSLRKKGYTVYDPATDIKPMLPGGKLVEISEIHKRVNNGEMTENEAWRCFLRGDIVFVMTHCNAIYNIKNYKNSRGARWERDCMRRYNYPEFFEKGENDLLTL